MGAAGAIILAALRTFFAVRIIAAFEAAATRDGAVHIEEIPVVTRLKEAAPGIFSVPAAATP